MLLQHSKWEISYLQTNLLVQYAWKTIVKYKCPVQTKNNIRLWRPLISLFVFFSCNLTEKELTKGINLAWQNLEFRRGEGDGGGFLVDEWFPFEELLAIAGFPQRPKSCNKIFPRNRKSNFTYIETSNEIIS